MRVRVVCGIGGRMERVFGTLQNRIPQDLRILGLDTMAAANAYLRDHFMADHNARFAVTPTEPADGTGRRNRPTEPADGTGQRLRRLSGCGTGRGAVRDVKVTVLIRQYGTPV